MCMLYCEAADSKPVCIRAHHGPAHGLDPSTTAAQRSERRAAAEPQFEQKLLFPVPKDWKEITLTLLDKDGKPEAGLRFPSVRQGGCLGRAAALREGTYRRGGGTRPGSCSHDPRKD